MKTTTLIFCFFLFCFAGNSSAQLLSPISHVEGTILPSTQSVFIGQIDVIGTFQGYPLDLLPDNPFINNISAFPLLGSTILENIDRVTIVDTESFDLDSLEDYLDLTDPTEFTDIDIKLDNGLFLLGSDDGELSVDTTFEYAISTIYPIELEDISATFFILLSMTQTTTRHQGELAAIMQYTENGTMEITNSIGEILWTSSTADTLLLIEDEQFLLTQQSSVYLYPLIESSEKIELTVTPSPPKAVNIDGLLEEITTVAQTFGEIPDINNMIEGFESIVSAAASIINGGMLLVETSDNFIVDDTLQQFTQIGFARGEQINIQISPTSQVITVEGETKLIFLGDHFYSTQAKESDNGITFPIVPIILWIAGIALFYFMKYYLKKENDETLDQKLSYYALIFHIIAIIVVFILIDREISFKFGYSAFDSILGQGFSFILLIFLAIQLLMWGLGYVLFAFPLRLLINSVLLYFGYGRKGKHIGTGVALFSIWAFTAFYVTVFLNFAFLFLNPTSILPVG